LERYTFSNSNIDLASDQVAKFLASAGVERREALRIRLSFEEVLLKYQAKFGEEAFFKFRCAKRFPSIKIEIIVENAAFDPLDEAGEEDDVIRSMLARIGLAPSWSYRKGKNYIVFIAKKKPLSDTVKMAAAIVLAILCGVILNLLPEAIRTGANTYVLTPVTNAFMGLISAVSGPLVFLSVLGSICSMGNMETLGKIGSRVIKVILIFADMLGADATSGTYQLLSFAGDAGFYFLPIIIGAFASITVEPARPPRIASNTFCGSTPAFFASTSASPRAAMLHATMI